MRQLKYIAEIKTFVEMQMGKKFRESIGGLFRENRAAYPAPDLVKAFQRLYCLFVIAYIVQDHSSQPYYSVRSEDDIRRKGKRSADGAPFYYI